MKNFGVKTFVFALTAVLFYAASWQTLAQTRPYRVTDRQVSNLLLTIESDVDVFSRELEVALDRSSWNGTRTEDEIKNYVRDFEEATDRLKERFESRTSVSADVTEVLNRAVNIDRFLQQYRFNARVSTNWNRVRTDLNNLARYYNINFNWNQPVSANPGSNTAVSRLTGTYRLDVSRSADVQAEIDRVTADLNPNQRDRIRRNAGRRLEAPTELAIERTGRTITIASTNSPRVTFEADGRTQSEQTRNGRTMSISANLYGDQLVINYTGDRMNDFYVAFNPLRTNDELRVTRRIYLEGVNRQVTVDSYYTKTANVAQFDAVYRGYNNNAGGNNSGNNPVVNNTEFVIPNGTQLTAVLQNDLNTRQTQEGERFTMEVRSPAQYSGAVIEGRIARVERSGRISGRAELALEFETIRLRDNRTYAFRGFVNQVRPTGGDNVQIDNEGAVREGNSQTNRTIGRTAVGAALGAIIGAIAGGGQGAAVGAAVGAGAGAGSVVLQGRDDLNLKAGTEVTITSSAPREVAGTR